MEKLASKRSLLNKKVSMIDGWVGTLTSGLYNYCDATLESSYVCNYCLCSQRDESMRHIRELGSLPSDAFVKYNSFSQSQVKLCVCMSACVCV